MTPGGGVEAPVGEASGTAGAADESLDLCLVVVRLGAARIAFDVADVVEVLPLRDVTPLFDLPPHVLGVANLRGRVVPVSRLGALLRIAGDDDGRRGAPVGLVARIESREAIFAADEVLSVLRASSAGLGGVPSTIPEETRGFFRGLLPGAPPILVLRTDALLAPEAWPADAAGGAT